MGSELDEPMREVVIVVQATAIMVDNRGRKSIRDANIFKVSLDRFSEWQKWRDGWRENGTNE